MTTEKNIEELLISTGCEGFQTSIRVAQEGYQTDKRGIVTNGQESKGKSKKTESQSSSTFKSPTAPKIKK